MLCFSGWPRKVSLCLKVQICAARKRIKVGFGIRSITPLIYQDEMHFSRVLHSIHSDYFKADDRAKVTVETVYRAVDRVNRAVDRVQSTESC